MAHSIHSNGLRMIERDKAWRGLPVLVTGAGGFIGSHLTEELARRGAKVRALVHYNSRTHWGHLEGLSPELRRNVDICPGDVTDGRCVAEMVRGNNVVFHLAAQIAIPYSYIAPASFVQANIVGTLNVLEACRDGRITRLVHTSTSEVYGTARYTPMDEGHPLQGQSPYSASKIAADKLAESYHRSFGLPVVTVRPFNTFGPRQSARAVIPTIISQLLSGVNRLTLGSLEPVRDLNYVSDTVEGFLTAALAPKAVGQVVNIGSGKGWSIRQVAEAVMRLLGPSRRIPFAQDSSRIRPEASEVFRLVCDNRRAKRLLGWSPRYSLEEGLVHTIEHIRQHLSDYKAEAYNI